MRLLNANNLGSKRWEVDYLNNHKVPTYILTRFQKEVLCKYNIELNNEEIQMCSDSLMDFFKAIVVTEYSCDMPSLLADELWHAYIIHTKDYKRFCDNLGLFIHHIPDQDTTKAPSNDGKLINTLRTFGLTALIEGMDLDNIEELPLLFVIDELLPEGKGIRYDINDLKIAMEKHNIYEIIGNDN